MSIVPGRDIPEAPEAWVSAINKAINDENHDDLCGCRDWPDACAYYKPGLWDLDVDLQIAINVLTPLIQERLRGGGPDLFADVADITTWIDNANPAGPHEDAMRVLHIQEEAGEAATAYLGMVGQNPRKGVTHTPEDFLGELADVAMAALTTIQHFTQDEAVTRRVLADKVAGIITRANIPTRARAAER